MIITIITVIIVFITIKAIIIIINILIIPFQGVVIIGQVGQWICASEAGKGQQQRKHPAALMLLLLAMVVNIIVFASAYSLLVHCHSDGLIIIKFMGIFSLSNPNKLDDDDDDLYIMVKCVCVCHEKVTKFVWPPPFFPIFFVQIF